ncbi:class III lanthipeptide [Shouchella lonarensis]|uniref:Uncharacterized protein n=1 Tax=Shouchella lonarensis TaxID=1464122 RepID=A0A1G6PF16_9BACI|nr:class III lanthipeptide [Shouchella lonarensis]SDC78154.1 hypothetical protein SAMN05421737_1181 [Shouchella lonarensis]
MNQVLDLQKISGDEGGSKLDQPVVGTNIPTYKRNTFELVFKTTSKRC